MLIKQSLWKQISNRTKWCLTPMLHKEPPGRMLGLQNICKVQGENNISIYKRDTYKGGNDQTHHTRFKKSIGWKVLKDWESTGKEVSYMLHLLQASIYSCHWEQNAGFAEPLVWRSTVPFILLACLLRYWLLLSLETESWKLAKDRRCWTTPNEKEQRTLTFNMEPLQVSNLIEKMVRVPEVILMCAVHCWG